MGVKRWCEGIAERGEWKGKRVVEEIKVMVFKGTNLQQTVNKPQRSNAQYNEYRQ